MIDYWLKVLFVVLLSYLLGAIPMAYVVARMKRVNIFEVGSGNMGATNVARAAGLRWGILAWVLDMGKGFVAIFVARQVLTDSMATATAIGALMCIIGHNWSIFAALITGKLRGGKGAAIAFGAMFIIAPGIMLVVSLIGSLIIFLTRYVSLAVLVMFAVATLWMIVLVDQQAMPPIYSYYSVLVALLILVRFRENIDRLLRGTERRLGERA